MHTLSLIIISTLLLWSQAITLDVTESNSVLQRDLDEILELIPKKQIQRLAIQYFITDKEFRGLLKFVQSDDFKQFWTDIFSQPMTKEFINFTQQNGVNLVDRINSIAKALGLPPYSGMFTSHPDQIGKSLEMGKISGGIKGFFEDLEKLIPKKDVKNLFDQKCKENPNFKKLFQILDFDRIETFFKTSKAAVKIMEFFKKFGVDMRYYFDLIRKGLKIP